MVRCQHLGENRGAKECQNRDLASENTISQSHKAKKLEIYFCSTINAIADCHKVANEHIRDERIDTKHPPCSYFADLNSSPTSLGHRNYDVHSLLNNRHHHQVLSEIESICLVGSRARRYKLKYNTQYDYECKV